MITELYSLATIAKLYGIEARFYPEKERASRAHLQGTAARDFEQTAPASLRATAAASGGEYKPVSFCSSFGRVFSRS